ncbi:cytochrome P450 [Agaricicola taiwanensis]|uniref:Cytochrome P450 n=1 Tax=Agaricicola taiwanensis TaxID=591372 RepID=A0A8J3DW96_9RHOB|nr:cytochrome P450 [Agaricicola taiwanensis]GGE49124.1 cytochrome P450 [Agaricicola taiwanensis]
MTDNPSDMPSEAGWDRSLALLREGYTFLPRRFRQYRSRVFESRIMLERSLCLQGAEAVRFFYQPDAFTRKAAIPPTTLKLLQGRGSVQTLDGAAHRHRKAMFMSLMTPASRARLIEVFSEEWLRRLNRWQAEESVQLLTEAEDILCRAACRWAGVVLPEEEAQSFGRDLAALIEGAGSIGPRNWRGLMSRWRADRRLRAVITDIRRSGREADTPAKVIALHRDLSGKLLDVATAANELNNILRPIVAIARFIAFGALALHDHPAWRERLAKGDDAELEAFTHEVRRYYPFFPAIAGRANTPTAFTGCPIPMGRRVIVDIYGSHRDIGAWQQPERFLPERFLNADIPDAFLPQGGGDHFTGHRCAGEWITIDVVKAAIRHLTTSMRYEVPPQDLTVSLRRMPAKPESGFIMSRVRSVEAMV